MRKKTVNHLADTIFWYLIYFMPIILYLCFLIGGNFVGNQLNDLSLATFFNNLGLNFVTDNVILSALNSIFGINGVLPIFNELAPLYIFSWFISAVIIHLFVDFLLFIPRLAHKWLNVFTQGE